MNNFNVIRRGVSLVCAVCLCGATAGCKKEQHDDSSHEPASGADDHAGHDHGPGGHAPAAEATPPAPKTAGVAAPADGKLVGVAFEVPEGWVEQTPDVNPMMPSAAPKVQYGLPAGEAGDVVVQVTHYPGMAGMPNMVEMNLGRWYGQITQPDGSPTTDETANKTVFDAGVVHVTMVDITGGKGGDMMGDGEAEADQRMIAAILEHPAGPHFVKASGAAAAVAKWQDSITAYIRSARTD